MLSHRSAEERYGASLEALVGVAAILATRIHFSLNKDAPVLRGVEWAGNIVCRPIWRLKNQTETGAAWRWKRSKLAAPTHSSNQLPTMIATVINVTAIWARSCDLSGIAAHPCGPGICTALAAATHIRRVAWTAVSILRTPFLLQLAG